MTNHKKLTTTLIISKTPKKGTKTNVPTGLIEKLRKYIKKNCRMQIN